MAGDQTTDASVAANLERLRLVAEALLAGAQPTLLLNGWSMADKLRVGQIIWPKIQAEVSEKRNKNISARIRGEVTERAGETRELVGAKVGMKGTQLERGLRVIERAQGNPDRFGDLLGLLETQGGVGFAFSEMQRRMGYRKPGRGGSPPERSRNHSRSNPALRGTRKLDPNREVEKAAHTLGAIAFCFEQMDLALVNAEKVLPLFDTINSAISTIVTIERRVKLLCKPRQ